MPFSSAAARARDAIQLAGPAAPEAAALEGFQSAFTVIVVVAAAAALLAAGAFAGVARGLPTGAGAEPTPVPGPGRRPRWHAAERLPSRPSTPRLVRWRPDPMAGLEHGHLSGRTTPIPALAPRGQGWVLIQPARLAGVVLAGPGSARWPARRQGPALVIAVVAGSAGLGLAAAAIATLGRSVSPFPEPPATSELEESGGYALVRHPSYGGVLLVSVAWSLGLSPWALIPTAALNGPLGGCCG